MVVIAEANEPEPLRDRLELDERLDGEGAAKAPRLEIDARALPVQEDALGASCCFGSEIPRTSIRHLVPR